MLHGPNCIQYDSTVGRCVHLDAVLLAVQRAGSVHVYAVSGLNLNESQHHRIGRPPLQRRKRCKYLQLDVVSEFESNSG